MGVYVSRVDDSEMYKDTYEEAQRIIRISDEPENTESFPEIIDNHDKNNFIIDLTLTFCKIFFIYT